jgi:hypothetical protein
MTMGGRGRLFCPPGPSTTPLLVSLGTGLKDLRVDVARISAPAFRDVTGDIQKFAFLLA